MTEKVNVSHCLEMRDCSLQVGGELLHQAKEYLGGVAGFCTAVVINELNWKANPLIQQLISVPTLIYGHEP